MSVFIASFVTFIFTVVLTIAGVGAAFILIPIFDTMGIPIRVAMSTALLLNCIAMVFASGRYMAKGLIDFRAAIPILIVASVFSPIGAWFAQYVPEVPLRWLFVCFLLFAAFMMLFYKGEAKKESQNSTGMQSISLGAAVGAFAGFVGGLLGVGGGNLIVPVLVWLGYGPKRAAATTSFVVIFSSFSGFLGHATVGEVSWILLGVTAVGSIAGALLGSYLMTEKLKKSQVKLVIGLVLLAIAGKMVFGLLV